MLWLTILILAIVFLVAVRTIRAMRGRVEAPSCARCGYCVTGLESYICPECGSNLNQVGVKTSRSAEVRTPSLFGALTMWTMIAGLSGWYLTTLVREAWPRTAEWTGTTSFRLGEPATGAYSFISMDQQIQMPGGLKVSAPVEVRVWDPDVAKATMPLVVYVGTNEIEFLDSANKRERLPLSVTSIRTWYVSRGLDDSSEAATEEIASIVRVLSDPRHWRPLLRRSGGSVSGRGFELVGAGFDDATMNTEMIGVYPVEWIDFVPGIIWWMLWMAGVLFLLRKYRRS